MNSHEKNVENLIDLINSDDDLAKKLEKCQTQEEFYQLLQQKIPNLTSEEFHEISDEIEKICNSKELTEKELESVSGGISNSVLISIFALFRLKRIRNQH